MARWLGWTLVVALLGGCAHQARPTGAAPPSLAASLEQELGVPVAILPSAKGLLAVSADGQRQRVLVPPPIDWALVDNRSQVVWFGGRGAIRVLDLSLAGPAPELVVADLPSEVIEGSPGVVIDHGEEMLEIGHPAYHRVILSLGATPTLSGDSGAWTDDEEFPAAVAARRLSPAVQARLLALWQRGAGRGLAKSSSAKVVGPVEVDVSGCPDDETMCGQASEIPATKLWRVVVGFSCGDGCYPSYAVYDPEAKRFVEVAWIAHLQMAWMSLDGQAIVHDGSIVRLDARGTVFAGGEGLAGGGWLGESWYLPF